MLLEFSLGKLACEVFQCNHRPAREGRGMCISFDMTCLTWLHGCVVLSKVFHLIYYTGSSTVWSDSRYLASNLRTLQVWQTRHWKTARKRKVISHFYRAWHLIGQLFVLVVMRNNITGNHLLSLSFGII